MPTLTRTEDGFELAYPEAGEVYRFALRHDSTNQPMYTLVYAKMGDMEVAKRENFGYLVTQGEDGAVWSKMVTLADFNIHQMPRGTADVRRMNEMACGLQRFANVRKDGVKEIRQEWRHVPIQTVCGTYLTDDPHVSEAHQEELPAGTKLAALGYCGWAYVYVEAEVDGETLYGFVPQRDVIFDDVEQPELMAEFVGHWRAKGAAAGTMISSWMQMGIFPPRMMMARGRAAALGLSCRPRWGAISTGGATFPPSSCAERTARCPAMGFRWRKRKSCRALGAFI